MKPLTTLVHNIFGWNFLNRLGHRLPRCDSLFFHGWRDGRCELDSLGLDVVAAFSAARLHIYNVEAEALLLDAVVGVYRDGVVVVLCDAVLNRRRLDVQVLCRCLNGARMPERLRRAAVVVRADRWRGDGDCRGSVSVRRHGFVAVSLSFSPPFVWREESNGAGRS